MDATKEVLDLGTRSGMPRVDYEASAGRVSNLRIRTANRGLVRAIGMLATPVLAPLVLFASVWAWAEPFSAAWVILGALSFFIQFPGRWPDRSRLDPGLQVVSPWVLTLLILGLIGLASGTLDLYDPQILVTWALVTPLLQIVLLQQMPGMLALLVRLRRDKRRVVIVGANEVGRAFAKALDANRIAHSEVVAFFDDRAPKRLNLSDGRTLAGSMADLVAYTRCKRVDQIYIALPLSSHPRIVRQLKELRDCTASVYFIPDLMAMDLIQPRLDTHAGFPVVSICESPFNGADGLVKRGLDILFASIAVVVLAPLMAVIAAAVKATSPGPVLFRQRRYGMDGNEIIVWKFRTMTVTEDGATSYTQVVRGDSRLTSIGPILRKTSLDELPQFFNVLQGRMSIVGPRPHAVMVNEQYRRKIAGYMVRHKVRPGITGWAQVHGFRGGDDLELMAKRIEYDLEYLRRWSIWMDLRILLRTVFLVLKDSRAF